MRTLTWLELKIITSYVAINTKIDSIVDYDCIDDDSKLGVHFFYYGTFNRFLWEGNSTVANVTDNLKYSYIASIFNNIIRKTPITHDVMYVKRGIYDDKMSTFLKKNNSKLISLPFSSTTNSNYCSFGGVKTLNKLNKGSQLLNISFLTSEKELLLQSGIVVKNNGMIKNLSCGTNYIYLECVNCGYNDEKYNSVKYQINNEYGKEILNLDKNDLSTLDRLQFKSKFFDEINKINNIQISDEEKWFNKYKKYKSKYFNLMKKNI